MENKTEAKQRLEKEGFTLIHEYDDPANEFFPEHDHETDQKIIVLRGAIDITTNGKTVTLRAGDEFFFPARMPHSATVGPEGCLYLDGENKI